MKYIYSYFELTLFMMTFPVFVIMQRIKVPYSPALSRLASMTFGIYLCHFVFVQIGYDMFAAWLPKGVPAVVHIICIAVAAFFISYLIVRMMSAFKVTRRFVV